MKRKITLIIYCTICSLGADSRSGVLDLVEQKLKASALEMKYLAHEAVSIAQDASGILKKYEASITARLSCEKPDEHSATPAAVSESIIDEQTILSARRVRAQATLKTLLNQENSESSVPVVAFCGSGGGTRAMLETLGWLSGAKSIGLLDALQYVSGLSGSTWALNPWILSKLSLEEFTAHIVPRLSKSLHTHIQEMSTTDRYDMLSMLARSSYNNRQMSPIDLYGGLLAHIFIKGLPNIDDPYEVPMSSLQPQIISGEYPYVLSTCVLGATNALHELYDHNPSYELSPFCSGSFELKSFVPTWSLGRPFSRGVSLAITPHSLFPEISLIKESVEWITPQYTTYIEALSKLMSLFDGHDYYGQELPLGYLIGICGSAFAVDIYDLLVELYQFINPGSIDPTKKEPLEILIRVVQDALEQTLGKLGQQLSSGKFTQQEIVTYLQDHELGAASIPNPSFQLETSLTSTIERFALVDAGLEIIDLDRANIGIMPLLFRNVDVIFICDSSQNIKGAPSLRASQALAHKLGLPFPHVDYEKIDSQPATLIFDESQPNAPIIVYMPAIDNPDYDKKIGRHINPHIDLYRAQNFKYTPQQADDLMGLITYNVEHQKDILIKAVSLAVQKKNRLMSSSSRSKRNI